MAVCIKHGQCCAENSVSILFYVLELTGISFKAYCFSTCPIVKCLGFPSICSSPFLSQNSLPYNGSYCINL
uniref:Uncharacterized protein n=1 Tax=Arundo donax TaxID=35708 RepID=A0A0A9E8Q4_ARUDO